MPSGGTTDWAIEMIYDAIQGKSSIVYVSNERDLPYVYIDDLIVNTLRFLEADSKSLTRRDYLLGSFSITPKRLGDILREKFPSYNYTIKVDFRDDNAKQWPGTVDYSQATKDWQYKPEYDETTCIDQMIKDVRAKLDKN